MQIKCHLLEYVCKCVSCRGNSAADKRGDCQPGALNLIEHTVMLIENPLFIRADRSDRLRDPLTERTQINDLKLCWSNKWWERQTWGGSQLLRVSSHWLCNFLWRDWPANLLLIQWVERRKTGLAVLYQTLWGLLPQTEAKQVGVKLITPCFPCLQASGEVTSKDTPHTSRRIHTNTHTRIRASYLPFPLPPYPSFSPFLTSSSVSLCGPYADVLLRWTEKWGFTLCKTWSSQHAEC